MNRRFSIILLGILIIWMSWFYLIAESVCTPFVTHLVWLPPITTSFMQRDHHTELLYRWVPLSKISPFLQSAAVIAEDDLFYEHPGFDSEAMKKAWEVNMKRHRFARGASTITMQLARNLYLNPHKSIIRKFKEILIALKIERELPKNRILELYLNIAEMGDGIYGAEAAAQHYFKKSASALTRHESAFIAAVLPNPKFYDRFRGGNHLRQRVQRIERNL